MTIDPKKIREIARVCATLSKSAPTAEEHDIFANLTLKWLSIALDRKTRLAIDLDRFWQSANKRPARGWDSNPRYGYPHNGFRVLRILSPASYGRILVNRKASGSESSRNGIAR